MGATLVRGRADNRLTAAAAVASGEVRQLADGRAGAYTGLNAAALGDRVNYTDTGKFTLDKTASIVLLDGGRAYWDRSAAKVHYKKVNDRDYYLGRIVGDAASADTTCVVDLNVDPAYDVDLLRDGALTVPTGTQAVGGFGYPKKVGGATLLELTATSEAQCIDLLSVDRFAVAANPILEAIIRIPVNGSGAAVDFNIGLANGTSTTDADAVAEHCFVHVDGADLSLFVQSKDGTTTVAAADSTVDATAGGAVANRVEIWIDARLPEDVQVYVNGVLVLGATVFRLDNATGPLGLLAHLEKTTGTTTAQFVIDALRARFAEQ